MEISGAVRQAAVPSGVVRPSPPPAVAGSGGSPAPAAPSPGLSREAVIRLAAEAGGGSPPHGARLRVDENTDRIVLEVLDANNEVVKQIPPEAWLHAIAQTRQITGLILDQST